MTISDISKWESLKYDVEHFGLEIRCAANTLAFIIKKDDGYAPIGEPFDTFEEAVIFFNGMKESFKYRHEIEDFLNKKTEKFFKK